MQIRLNGEMRDVAPGTLDAVLVALGYGEAIVATAVNGEFVPATGRRDLVLSQGDQLEVLAPMQGG